MTPLLFIYTLTPQPANAKAPVRFPLTPRIMVGWAEPAAQTAFCGIPSTGTRRWWKV